MNCHIDNEPYYDDDEHIPKRDQDSVKKQEEQQTQSASNCAISVKD